MAYLFSNNYTRNYRNRKTTVKVISEGWGYTFFAISVFSQQSLSYVYIYSLLLLFHITKRILNHLSKLVDW